MRFRPANISLINRRHYLPRPRLTLSSKKQKQKPPQRFADVDRVTPYHFWCACGKSANQPFCDGSHKGSEFTPIKFEATETKTVYFCGCKHTANPVMCDGTHKTL